MQNKKWSTIESIFTTAIAFIVAYFSQMAIYPLFGIHISPARNLALVAVFTVIIFVRSYLVRRLFNWWGSLGIRNKEDEMRKLENIKKYLSDKVNLQFMAICSLTIWATLLAIIDLVEIIFSLSLASWIVWVPALLVLTSLAMFWFIGLLDKWEHEERQAALMAQDLARREVSRT